MTKLLSTLATADMIERVAVAGYAAHAASVVRYTETHGGALGLGGAWYALAIKGSPGDEWAVVARRRTKAELLEFVENRRYKVSTRPVGARYKRSCAIVIETKPSLLRFEADDRYLH